MTYLIPLDQWRQAQPAMAQSALADMLTVDRLYEIDGGMFQSRQAEDGRLCLSDFDSNKALYLL